MPEHDLEKLLGGFAADTLTAEERTVLYKAALQDQQLFIALADEQALKELLNDPAVRRRLLQALNQPSPSGAAGSRSWFDWFRRPAGLAWAGGLTAAVVAVVLGTRMYQDSLKQAARSVATEETTPATPPTPMIPPLQSGPALMKEAELKAKKNLAPPVEPKQIEAMADKSAKRERAAPSPPAQMQTAPGASRGNITLRTGRDEARRQAETPVEAVRKSDEQPVGTIERKDAAAMPTTTELGAQAAAPPAGAAAGARRLFYTGGSERSDQRMTAQEQARKPPSEPAPEADKPARMFEQLSQLSGAKRSSAARTPLGLRYSFVVRGADGRDRVVDASRAAESGDPAQLTIESNQDAYLQVWITVGSSVISLLWPDKDTGQISMKILAGRRQSISLPSTGDPITLAVRLSRVPFGPITKQEAAMFDRPSPDQLQESLPQEQATYVATPDLSPLAQLTTEIPLGTSRSLR
ncbi:MAG: hypothetical protein P0111_13045 [Nitrospira sp.]|nr:hypothetical protein [Nitrospira sp.]